MYLEDGSFDDGWAPYARFFKPLGITVTRGGEIVWIADYGNNKIRNLTCQELSGPTFKPTAIPTTKPTSESTQMPLRTSGMGKDGKYSAKQGKDKNTAKSPSYKNTKSKIGKVVLKKESKYASRSNSIDGIVSSYTTIAFSLSSDTIIAISFVSLLLTAIGVYLAYYRRRLFPSTVEKTADSPKTGEADVEINFGVSFYDN
jgi:hypothetical protein